jgi:hypothetical protein
MQRTDARLVSSSSKHQTAIREESPEVSGFSTIKTVDTHKDIVGWCFGKGRQSSSNTEELGGYVGTDDG